MSKNEMIYSKNSILIDDTKKPEESEKEIGVKFDDFEILQLLAKSQFISVFKVKSKINKKIYAMKIINLDTITIEKEKNIKINSVNIIKELNCFHTIKYRTNFTENNKIHIIMDYINSGDLEGYIKCHMSINKPIPEEEVLNFFYQIISGLCYCHKKSIIYRDIKPANIIMTNNKFLKIGGFCISTIEKEGAKENTAIGTLKYMSPEMFKQEGYDSKVDVYALGCTFHVMCYFYLPRDIITINDIYGKHGEIVDIDQKKFSNWNFYSNDIKDLIYRMIDRKVSIRPSSEEVFNNIKELYNKKNKNNSSIFCAFKCLCAFLNLTNYIEKEKSSISQNIEKNPIANALIDYISNISNKNNDSNLIKLRDILTQENPNFPDPEEIDCLELIKFILQKIHLETNSGSNKDIIIFGNSLDDFNKNIQNAKSIINDNFLGIIKKESYCESCKKTYITFNNYYQLTFDIDQAMAIGIWKNNDLINYFINLNKMQTNNCTYCNYCKKKAYIQETKKIINLPKNLIICFKGENDCYDNKYINAPLKLNFEQIDIENKPKEYQLKSMIKCIIEKEQKHYRSIYLAHEKNKWFSCNGYEKKEIDSPNVHTTGDIITLSYASDE